MADESEALPGPLPNATRSEEAGSVRELPHSAEVERAVLAVLLDGRNPAGMQVVRQQAGHPLVFFLRNHRLIYQACLDLDDEGQRPDAHAVAELLKGTDFRVAIDRLRQQEQLADRDQLDALGRKAWSNLYRRRPEDEARNYDDSALAVIGGYPAIVEIQACFTTAAGLEAKARRLRDYYLKRHLIRHLTNIADSAYRTTKGFGHLLDVAGQAVINLHSQSGQAEVYDMGKAVDETLTAIQERHDKRDSGVVTGFEPLDEMLMALRPGGLYILAARPGVGKTSLALSIIEHVTSSSDEERDGAGVLLFSLEVDRVDLVKKLLCSKADLAFNKMERGLLEGPEWDLLTDAAERIKRWHLDLMDASDLTVQGLRSVVRRQVLERQGRVKLVVIDYLQLLGTARGSVAEYERISEISRVLKSIAREQRLPVLALSQMSRDSEKGAGPRRPRLSDLRGSGSIEQDADVVMFIHRLTEDEQESPDSDSRDLEVIVGKNRFGRTGSLFMRFYPARQRFVVVPRREMMAQPSMPTEITTSRRQRLEKPVEANEDVFP